MDKEPDDRSELFQPDTPRGPGLSMPELFALMEEIDPGLAARVEARREASGPLGRQLYSARIRSGLTQSQLSERSGVRQSDISELECGGGNPTRSTLEKLGVALNIDFSIGASSAA